MKPPSEKSDRMGDERAQEQPDRKPPSVAGDDGGATAIQLVAKLGAPVDEILASISDGLIALDNEWRFTYVNAAAERLSGYRAQDVIGRRIFVDPNNPFQANYLASKASGEPTAFAAYSDMFRAWIEVRGYPHPGGYTIFFRDVSAERAAHRSMLEREGRLESAAPINQRLFETSLDLILVVDRKGNLIRVSPSSLAILGYRPDEMAGRSATEFLYPEDLGSTRNEMRLARRGRSMRTFDCRYVHRDGHAVPLAWTGVWSEPEQQHFFIGRDMTDSVRLEQQLRQAQKMEAVGQLTGGVAHDFNNILTVITSTIEILAEAVEDDPKLVAVAKLIADAAERGAQLTQRMLAFARRQPLQARATDLNETVTRMASMLRRTLGEHVAVKTALADSLWDAWVDPAQVEDALLNLAVNARDAMPLGGQIVLETGNVHLDAEYAAQNLEVAPGDYVSVMVTDSGTGMTPDVLEHAFEPFFTTKDVGFGSGLGLSMVYGFVKQSRGHVKVYSEVGHGTSIKLYLPRARDGTGAATDIPVPSAEAHPVGRETILVVEDDAAVRAVAVGILQSLGYRVREAEDGVLALDMLQMPGDIDLLFTDLIMPNGLSGQDLLRLAREQRPGLKVLFTSGYSEHFIDGRGDIEQIAPLLSKPYRRQNLAIAIRSALDGHA